MIKFFNHYLEAKSVEPITNKEQQLKGIDCYVILQSGTKLKVDNKVRRTAYTDICFEIESNQTSVGWAINPTKETDLIAYYSHKIDLLFFIGYKAAREYICKNWKDWQMGRRPWGVKRTIAKQGGSLSFSIQAEVLKENQIKVYEIPNAWANLVCLHSK